MSRQQFLYGHEVIVTSTGLKHEMREATRRCIIQPRRANHSRTLRKAGGTNKAADSRRHNRVAVIINGRRVCSSFSAACAGMNNENIQHHESSSFSVLGLSRCQVFQLPLLLLSGNMNIPARCSAVRSYWSGGVGLSRSSLFRLVGERKRMQRLNQLQKYRP